MSSFNDHCAVSRRWPLGDAVFHVSSRHLLDQTVDAQRLAAKPQDAWRWTKVNDYDEVKQALESLLEAFRMAVLLADVLNLPGAARGAPWLPLMLSRSGQLVVAR